MRVELKYINQNFEAISDAKLRFADDNERKKLDKEKMLQKQSFLDTFSLTGEYCKLKMQSTKK